MPTAAAPLYWANHYLTLFRKETLLDVLQMIIYVTLILGFLVFIHEGGHYLASRASACA